uniref:Uncharacterized protein n=1 Tax=virus sp. ctkyY8 TaxID=2827995 RepID=A0A8S5RDV1_9VIRU|nr:MAG TPA: protein of unknown function (DUF3961) [virus sp. ctkyY8]
MIFVNDYWGIETKTSYHICKNVYLFGWMIFIVIFVSFKF